MKKRKQLRRKVLSLLLMVAILLSIPGLSILADTMIVENVIASEVVPDNPVHHCTKKNNGSDYTDWSYVYFGSYPQSEVSGDALTADIINASYNENGDAWVDEFKYRRISKEDTNYDGYFGDAEYRYFVWEKIKWRVLKSDGETLFLMADKGLDCKNYDDDKKVTTWETCTLRAWLNNEFYANAFSKSEKKAIISQEIENSDNIYSGVDGGNNTTDNLFILSLDEITQENYGFCSSYEVKSASRRLNNTDYSHIMGAYSESKETYLNKCCWWIRTPGTNSYDVIDVDYNGYGYGDGDNINSSDDAVVPALYININSECWSFEDTGKIEDDSEVVPANPIHHCTKRNDGSDYTDWSYVYFGHYPQTEVTGAELTSEITEASYNSNGDAWVNGTKYRRISKSDTNHDRYFGDSVYRYFRWERIKWRVLENNGSTLFVVADQGMDCKAYNDEYTSITWENCTLRNWLNRDFYSMAFNKKEQSAIVTQTVANNGNSYTGVQEENDTFDNVFLLSGEEITNYNYGFCGDHRVHSVSRRLALSNYANIMGAATSDSEGYPGYNSSWWWLRTPAIENHEADVSYHGYANIDNSGRDVNSYNEAIRPALHINLSSNCWSTEDDGTSGDQPSPTFNLFNNEIGLYIYRKDTHSGVSNFRIYVDDLENEIITDSTGAAKVKLEKGKHTLYFTNNEGYNTQTVTVTDCQHQKLYSFGVVPISDKPELLSAECMVSGKIYNVLNSELKLEENDTFDLELVGSTPSSTYITNYELRQGDSCKKESIDGTFKNLSAKDFDKNKKIYVCMNMSNGTVKTTWLRLSVEADRIVEQSTSIKLGEEINIKLDDSYPVIGGLDLKVDLGRLPVYYEQSNGKYKVAVNIKRELNSDGKWEGDCLTDDVWKTFKEGIKKNTDIDKILETQLKELSKPQTTPFQKFGKQKLDVEVYGYMEGSKDSLEGQIVVKFEAKPDDVETQFAIASVPMVFVLSVKGEIEGNLEIKINEMNFSQPQITGGLTPEATISVGVGPGLAKAAYVTANGSGKLKDEMRYNFSNKYLWQELTFAFSFFAKLKIFFLEAELPFAEKEVVLFTDRTDYQSAEGISLANESIDFGLNDIENYSIQNHIAESDTIVSQSATSLTKDDNRTLLQEDVYSYTDMELIETKDITMLVYMADNKERASGDGSMLMYSILNRDTGIFEQPRAIEDDGTGDFTPSITSDENHIYVAWSEFQKQVGETDEIDVEEIASSSEIKLGIYDKESNTFEIVQVTDNQQMDVYPSIAVHDDAIAIVWAVNENNNLLLSDSNTEIKYCTFADGIISEKKTIVSDISSLETVLLANVNGKECVAYTNDKDADITTEGNYLQVYSLDGKRMLTLDGYFRDLQYQNGLSKPILTWNAGGVIKYLNEDLSVENYMPAENKVDGKYVIDEKDGIKTVYFIKNMELNANNVVTSELACYTDNGMGEWSKAAVLSDENQRVSDFVIYSENDEKKYAYNELILSEDATVQEATVYENEIEDWVDISVTDFNYQETVSEDLTQKVSVECKFENIGSLPVKNMTICVKDGDTILGQAPWVGTLLQGESTSYATVIELENYPVEDTNLTVDVVAEGDVDAENNQKDIVLGHADLDIDIEETWEEDGVYFNIQVKNHSLHTVSDATLCIYEKGNKENPIETMKLEAIDIHHSSNTVYYLPYEELEFTEDTKMIYFELESSSEESFISNNKDFSVIENPASMGQETIDVLLEDLTLSNEKLEIEVGEKQSLYVDLCPYNATNVQKMTWSTSDSTVASVNEVGEIQALKEGTCVITVMVNELYKECAVTVTETVESNVEEEVVYNENTVHKYTITATAQSGGSITPSRTATVEEGEDITYRIEVEEGYLLSDVKVDGESIGAIAEYTFEDVSADHTIEVFFTEIAPIKVEKIELSKAEISLEKGNIYRLTAQIYPETAENQTVKWSTSNNNVVTVENGLVIAVGKGIATITVESMDGSNVSAECVVTVIPKEYNITATAQPGGRITPKGTTLIEEGEDKIYRIEAEEGYVLSDVKVDGKSIGAVTEYTFEEVVENHTIEALFAKEENKLDENTKEKITTLKLESISKKIAAGKTVALIAKITPSNVANKKLTWSTSNSKFATVSDKGVVTTKKAGKGKQVIITAEATDGSGVKASIKLKLMKNAVTKVRLAKTSKNIAAGKTLKLKAIVKTNGKDVNKKLKWSTSNKNYATVDSKGKVRTKKAGRGKRVTITVMSTDGTNKRAKIRLKISQ